MTYMLDTNICIYAIKNKPEQVLRRLKDNLPKGLCISAITLAELEHGVEKSVNPEKNQMALIQFLAILDILPFDDLAAAEYGNICAYLQKRGTPIGTMDMLIAGHARAEGLILVTNNVREFMRVPNLGIENWAEAE
ncbi:type II toxin-antitoxin system tRNA(fMet)-specific endonuclease VapC [Merdimmobilis hominis]|uniref:type II toxin-antitoxin system tRNA(fMet)-specific endonuclease VapC n=1 Tax=Merdimmobilis hominis TaxID=2897707 RepID=UPI0008F8CD43|nr:type II toxin-antitoxin system VapC family toxin [Merdimmobilis hominis]